MGNSYEYKCDKCGFKHKYSTGGGFLSEEYFNETEKLEMKLKEAVAAGKYGPILKSMIEADVDENICFSCGTELFQCRECWSLLVHREKHIGLSDDNDNQYELDIDIKQSCPECGSDKFEKIDILNTICPKCKSNIIELENLIKWD